VLLSEERWRERGLMDYEWRIMVEKVAISRPEGFCRKFSFGTHLEYALSPG